MIAGLRARGIGRIIMVTGDREQVARGVGAALGIHDVRAEVFPEQKAAIVEELQAAGHRVGDRRRDQRLAGAGVRRRLDLYRRRHGRRARDGGHGAARGADAAAGVHRPGARDRPADPRGHAHRGGAECDGHGLATFGFVGPLASTALNNGSTIVAGMNSLRPLRAAALPAPQAPRDAAPIAPQAALPAPREAAPIAPETAPAGGTHDLAS